VKLRSVVPLIDCLQQNLTHNQIEDMNSSAQLSAAQHLASSGAGVSALAEKPAGGDNEDDDDIPELEAAVEDEGPVDETGVDPKDIDLVMAAGGLLKGEGCPGIKREWWRPDQCEYVPTSSIFS
jgi:hypothetical protein